LSGNITSNISHGNDTAAAWIGTAWQAVTGVHDTDVALPGKEGGLYTLLYVKMEHNCGSD